MNETVTTGSDEHAGTGSEARPGEASPDRHGDETSPDPHGDEASPGPHGDQDITALLLGTLAGLARETRETRAGEPASEAAGRPRLGDLVTALDERAFGLLLLVFALPCCVPLLWGIPQVVALPMLALTGQIAAGRQSPWLPAALADRRFDAAAMQGVVRRTQRYVGWAERLARPRLTALTEGRGLRVVGALLAVPCASILVPLPSTNTAPGIGVAIASVGLIERDGLLVLAGLLLGLAWVAFLITITVLLGAEATSIVKDWAMGLLGR